MSVDCQDRVQRITELVRGGGYQIDSRAVADAIVNRIIWDDVPELTLLPEECRHSPSPRLRGLVRVRRVASAAVAGPTPLRARSAI